MKRSTEEIKIGREEETKSLYADDMKAMLSNISSVEKVMQTLHNFEKCSGLKGYVNWKEYKFFRDTSGPLMVF